MRHIHKTYCLRRSYLTILLILGMICGSAYHAAGQTTSDGRNASEPENQVVLTMDAANGGSADLALFYLVLNRWFPNPAKDPRYRGAAGTDRFRLEKEEGETYILCLIPIEAFDPDDGTVSLWWNIWSEDLVLIDGVTTSEYSPVSGGSVDLQMQQYTITVPKVALEFRNSHMSSEKMLDPLIPHRDVRIGVMQGDSIRFKATLIPDNVSLPGDHYVWSGVQSGNGETIDITFNSMGTHSEHLQVLNSSIRTGRTTVMNVPETTEEMWGLMHPHRIFVSPTAMQLREEADAWVQDNLAVLGVDLHNGRADAARHAYWNAIMTVDWNAADAEGLATAHERTGLNNGNPHNESVMDLENNAEGRVIGSVPGLTRAAIHTAVIDALNAGDLTILDEVPNPEERGLLIPSNQ